MPIDPSIPLSIAPPPNPLQTFESIQNFGALQNERRALSQQRQAEADKLQQQQEQQAQFQQIIHESLDPATGVVDWDAAYKKMDERGLSAQADVLRKNAAAALQAQAKTTGDLLDNHQKVLTQLTSEMRAVRDSGSQGAYQQFVTHVAQAYGPGIAASMPTTPQAAQQTGWFDKATTWADSEKEDIDRMNALREAASATPKDAQAWTNHGAQVLGAADPTVTDPHNPMSYAFRLGMLSLQGMPSPILQQFKGVTPQQAAQMGISPEQRQQATDRATTEAREAAGQAFTQDMEKKRLVLEQQRVALEKQRNDLTANNNSVTDLTPFLNKTATGRAYINLADFQTPQQKSQAIKMANDQGIPYVDDKTDKGLRSMDRVRSTLSDILSQIQDQLPKDAAGRVTGGLENKLSKFTQNSPILAAYDSWRPAAIGMVQALADPGLGLRINKNEIDSAMNGLPLITDTAATAIQKVQNVLKLLSDKEGSTLTRDRSGAGGGAGGSVSFSYQGKTYTGTQAQIDEFKRRLGIK